MDYLKPQLTLRVTWYLYLWGTHQERVVEPKRLRVKEVLPSSSKSNLSFT
jgi:hypothetical protein